MEDYTISESVTLPSGGHIYDTPVRAEFRVRSMTTEDEMKRLSPSDRTYQTLCEILDDCILGERPGISSYDLCLGDYQVLLHKVRVATYGPEYPLEALCPYCQSPVKVVVDLDQLEVQGYNQGIQEKMIVMLPVSKKKVKLRFQTPRILDNVELRAREVRSKNPELKEDFRYLLSITSAIDLIDDRKVEPHKLEAWVRQLPQRDTNLILRRVSKLNQEIGIKTTLEAKCGGCGGGFTIPFRYNTEFFGPTEE